MAEEYIIARNPELDMLRLNKLSGYNYRERRHADWTENYTLYRDKVITNRLTQRQSVNLPLMKQTVRTMLKDVDDMPVLFFESLDNNKEAEIFKNEYWKYTVEQNNMELQDIVDKRQVFLYGRSFDQWQIVDGKVKMTIQDPQDIMVDRYTDPTDLNSSRFLIHNHIFKSLSQLEANPDYDQEEVKKLRQFYLSAQGLIKNQTNAQSLVEKNQRMADMGLSDVDSPLLGETIVELSMNFVYRKEEGDSEEQLYLYVEAEDMCLLMKKKLEDVFGVTKDHFWRNHYPYVSWADDLERTDFWSDSIGDIVRTPNKILNSWFSQMVENRTLRNYGMNYFDSTIEGFTPQTFSPIPWGWYGVPGKPQDVVQKIDIPDLSDSLDEMTYVQQMVERATGATATQQGVQTDRQVTLGEVKMALTEAKDRVQGMSKFYTPAWKQRGIIFTKLIEGSPDKIDAVTLYKKGVTSNDLYPRELSPKDWQTESGWNCKVWSQSEKDGFDTNELQKLNAVRANIPGNPKLEEVYQRKLLEFAGILPNDISDIIQFENEKRSAMASMTTPPMAGVQGQLPQATPAGQPAMLPQ